ncbi:MAG: hypothetical protein MUC67_06460 [Acidobacteria bacterium]|jgi:hypothetical protein|nr:hypothetical protein [Acidobacteriota bacterium]
MSTNRYAAAGWAAILSAAGTLAVLGLSFAFDLSKIAGRPEQFTPALWSLQQIVLVIAVDALAWILGIYALVKFRDLLAAWNVLLGLSFLQGEELEELEVVREEAP